MANQHRGEISAMLDGREWRLCLTLGALAELESRMGFDDIGGLAGHFGSGKLSAKDIVAIIYVGLKGSGHNVSEDEVRQMQSTDGIAGFARIVSALLAATFGADEVEAKSSEEGKPLLNPR